MQLPVRTCSGFLSPSSHARGAEPWLLGDESKTSNILITLRNLIEVKKKKQESKQGRLGKRAGERESLAENKGEIRQEKE